MLLTQVTWSITDEKGKPGQFLMYIDLDDYGGIDGDKIGEAVEYLDEVTRRIDALVMGRIRHYTLSIKSIPTGLKTITEAGADVEEGARFTYANRFSNVLPTFDHALFGDRETTLSVESNYGDNADLYSLIQLIVQSTDAPDWPAEYGNFTDNRGDDLTTFPLVQKRFKPSRR